MKQRDHRQEEVGWYVPVLVLLLQLVIGFLLWRLAPHLPAFVSTSDVSQQYEQDRGPQEVDEEVDPVVNAACALCHDTDSEHGACHRNSTADHAYHRDPPERSRRSRLLP